MQMLVEIVQQNLFEAAIMAVFIFVAVSIGVYFSRGRMADMRHEWTDFAWAHGLKYTASAHSVDYGGITGTRTFEFPGLMGAYHERQLALTTAVGSQGREQGRWLLRCRLEMQRPAPFCALAYKRDFTEPAKSRIARNSKTGKRSLDRTFKIRTQEPDFLVKLSEHVGLVQGIKSQKLRTAHIILDGTQLRFEGALNGFSATPEQALALVEYLSDLASAVETIR